MPELPSRRVARRARAQHTPCSRSSDTARADLSARRGARSCPRDHGFLPGSAALFLLTFLSARASLCASCFCVGDTGRCRYRPQSRSWGTPRPAKDFSRHIDAGRWLKRRVGFRSHLSPRVPALAVSAAREGEWCLCFVGRVPKKL